MSADTVTVTVELPRLSEGAVKWLRSRNRRYAATTLADWAGKLDWREAAALEIMGLVNGDRVIGHQLTALGLAYLAQHGGG